MTGILIAAAFVAVMLILAAMSRKRYRQMDQMEADEKRLAPGADAKNIDEDWEQHEFGEEGRH
jgi:hypothetical protein